MQPFADEVHRPFVFPAASETETGALLIHGFGGTPAELRPLGQALAGAGIAAHGIALPGFGEDLPALATTTVADWVDTAMAAWDDLPGRYRQTVLLGFSMGGAVALHVAARRPPDRLILLAPFLRITDWRATFLPIVKHVMHSFHPFGKADFDDPEVRAFYREAAPDADLDDPAVRAALRQQRAIPTAALDELRRVSREAGRIAPTVKAPTLVVQGTEDSTALPSVTRWLVSRLGGRVAFHEVEADHLLVLDDHPAWPAVRRLVTDFAAGEHTPLIPSQPPPTRGRSIPQ